MIFVREIFSLLRNALHEKVDVRQSSNLPSCWLSWIWARRLGFIVVISSSPSTIGMQSNETTHIQENVNSNAPWFTNAYHYTQLSLWCCQRKRSHAVPLLGSLFSRYRRKQRNLYHRWLHKQVCQAGRTSRRCGNADWRLQVTKSRTSLIKIVVNFKYMTCLMECNFLICLKSNLVRVTIVIVMHHVVPSFWSLASRL